MAARNNVDKPIVCKQCSSTIAREADSVPCEGFCQNIFHAECVKLSTEELDGCRTRPNLWWTCNQCTPLIREMRNERLSKNKHKGLNRLNTTVPTNADDTMNYSSEIVELKRQIAEIQETLADALIVKPRAEPHSLQSMTTSPIAQSSPLPSSSSKLLHGTKRVNNSSITDYPNFANDKFWLFFTKIKNDVSEGDISRMIAESLNSDANIEVKKLVPEWKNPTTLPYISFKAGIDIRFKEVALLSSTWPDGICFREFRNCVWEPVP